MDYTYRGLPDGYVLCKRCRRIFREDKAEDHFNTHRLNNEQDHAEAEGDTPLPFGSTNDLGRFAEKLLPNLDHTKNQGYAAREDRGKYGSYSSHDGYDDESDS